ncbi:hypothetical protein ACIBKZ_17985 [Streptomyces sp. NPDC050421]|uniref:hypothetical protein n=1 Tax=Streptomyces sp. NPDC050421 TaxID=3365613 RepID=UPI00379768E2
MAYAMHATTSLVAAEPGWSVKVTDLSDGDPTICPIVAWASVVTGFDGDGAVQTEVQPVFVAHGSTWTGAQYPLGPAPAIVPPLS